ncbi:MAG: NFACT family protein, partial [Candidatus Bathyarchaeia archaeon]
MPKKEFTSFDVAAVVQELKDAIAGSRVSNVYQTDAKTIVLKLHKPDKPNLQLILEAGRRLHQTSYFLEKPTVPPAFCMALRKYLRGSFLENVEQYEFERVVIFHFKTKLEVMRLVLELFGEGNIVLVNENNVILQALSYKRMRDRNILRNETFSFAPPIGRNPLTMTEKEFQQSLQNFPDMEIVRALARYFSLGGIYAEEALLSA